MEGWGPRQSQQGGDPQTSSSWARRLPTLGLLAPGLTLNPGWGQSAPAALSPGRMGPGLRRQVPPPPQTRTVSFAPKRSPKPPGETEIPASPRPSTAEAKGDHEGLSASVREALGAQSFRTAWQRPFIPEATFQTPELPSLQGAGTPARWGLPRLGCGRRLNNPHLPAGETLPKHAHTWLLGRNLGTRALVRVPGASALP